MPPITDTDRLNWMLEALLTNQSARYLLQAIGIDMDELEGPGDVTLGELVRDAIDRRLS